MSSSSSSSSSDLGIQHEYKGVGICGLLVVAFFWVSGGVFGNEALLYAAPPAYVFLALIIGPLVYGLPVALITAEMATALPLDGGLVAWVTHSCGSAIGAHYAYWLWAAYLLDSSVYPALAGEYFIDAVNLPESYDKPSIKNGLQSLFGIAIVVFITIIKLAGTNALVSFTSVLLSLSFLPVLVYVFWGFSIIKPSAWISTAYIPNEELDWTLYISWILWLYSGFFSLGVLAGEVDRPRRTFPVVIGLLMPFVMLVNIVPLAVAISQDQDLSHFDAGYFAILAKDLAGSWLEVMFTIAANLCLVGIYSSGMITVERTMASVVKHVFGFNLQKLSASSYSIIRFLFTENNTGVEPIFILLNAVLACGLLWLPYGVLVELGMLQTTLVALLFIYSFLHLRITDPTLQRPYKVPGGWFGMILVAVLPFICTMVNLYFAVTDPEDFSLGLPHSKVVGFGFLTGFGILVHLIHTLRSSDHETVMTFETSSESQDDEISPLLESRA